jgi:hypothetical protein
MNCLGKDRLNWQVREMIFEKKEISLEHNDEVIVELLGRKVPQSVSLTKFIYMNFPAFAESGRTTREIYEFLRDKNIDVSSYKVFKTLYSKAKRARETANSVATELHSLQNVFGKTRKQEMERCRENESRGNVRKMLVGDPNRPRGSSSAFPVVLSDEVEAIIDPATGAKSFEIKSTRRE